MSNLIVVTAQRLRDVGFMRTVAFLAILELVAVGYAANTLIGAANPKKANVSVPNYVSPVRIVRAPVS
jgi:uncharacterized membrane protein YhaH (DUF805 family)